MLATPLSLVPEATRPASFHYDEALRFLRDDVLDEFVALAARVFSLPISLFNLVDAHQVTTEAHYGMPDAPPHPRADALCSLVVEQNQVVIYHDLATAPQEPANAGAIQNALTKRIRFYAAAPVRLTNQASMGTLCLLDQQPREFTTEEQHVLQAMADTVSQAIAVRHLYYTTPGLGETHWQYLRLKLQEEVQALGALVRYLLMRYGTLIPVPEEVLHLVLRRLTDLHVLLQNKE
jgi:GAF domain-containing protein